MGFVEHLTPVPLASIECAPYPLGITSLLNWWYQDIVFVPKKIKRIMIAQHHPKSRKIQWIKSLPSCPSQTDQQMRISMTLSSKHPANDPYSMPPPDWEQQHQGGTENGHLFHRKWWWTVGFQWISGETPFSKRNAQGDLLDSQWTSSQLVSECWRNQTDINI